MNPINKSSLLQALGYGLAGAAAATLANETAKRARPSYSPLGFLSRRRRRRNQLNRTLAGALFSAPLLGNLLGRRIGGRGVKRELIRSALMGFGAGVGSFATPQQRGVLGGVLGKRQGRGRSGLGTIGRLLAGGLVAAAASRFLKGKLRDRNEHEPHTYDRYTNEPHTHEFRAYGRQTHDQPGV